MAFFLRDDSDFSGMERLWDLGNKDQESTCAAEGWRVQGAECPQWLLSEGKDGNDYHEVKLSPRLGFLIWGIWPNDLEDRTLFLLGPHATPSWSLFTEAVWSSWLEDVERGCPAAPAKQALASPSDREGLCVMANCNCFSNNDRLSQPWRTPGVISVNMTRNDMGTDVPNTSAQLTLMPHIGQGTQ